MIIFKNLLTVWMILAMSIILGVTLEVAVATLSPQGLAGAILVTSIVALLTASFVAVLRSNGS